MQTEYSARVEIWLEINDCCLSVAQVGDGSLILRENAPVSPLQHGRIILTVDGEDSLYPIVIRGTHGRNVEFQLLDPNDLQGTMF